MAQDNTKLWDFTNTNNNDFISTLIDLGASVSTIPKTLCDLLGFRDFDDCSLNLHLADSTIKKLMGRINDVLIVEIGIMFP